MRQIFTATFACLLLMQNVASAQTVAPFAQQQPATPVATAPVADVPITQNPDAMGQLTKALGNKNMQNNMGQVLVVGTLMGCVKKQVGQPAMQAFYSKMQTTGKSVEAFCKNDQPVQARDLVLKTLDENASDPVAQTTLSCYDAQAATIPAMGGQKLADDMARYANWTRNPAAAHQEMTPQDICRHQK